MKIKVLRNIGRLHEVPHGGPALPEEATEWREGQVVECADRPAKLLVEQKVAEETDDPVTSAEELRRRQVVAFAVNNPGAMSLEEAAQKAIERDRAAHADQAKSASPMQQGRHRPAEK